MSLLRHTQSTDDKRFYQKLNALRTELVNKSFFKSLDNERQARHIGITQVFVLPDVQRNNPKRVTALPRE